MHKFQKYMFENNLYSAWEIRNKGISKKISSQDVSRIIKTMQRYGKTDDFFGNMHHHSWGFESEAIVDAKLKAVLSYLKEKNNRNSNVWQALNELYFAINGGIVILTTYFPCMCWKCITRDPLREIVRIPVVIATNNIIKHAIKKGHTFDGQDRELFVSG